MAHIVAEPCFDCKYTDCVVVCPVDRFCTKGRRCSTSTPRNVSTARRASPTSGRGDLP